MWDVNLNFHDKLQLPTPNPPPYHQQLTDERISFPYHEQAKAREALIFHKAFALSTIPSHSLLPLTIKSYFCIEIRIKGESWRYLIEVKIHE
jgi:hypothetical protein